MNTSSTLSNPQMRLQSPVFIERRNSTTSTYACLSGVTTNFYTEYRVLRFLPHGVTGQVPLVFQQDTGLSTCCVPDSQVAFSLQLLESERLISTAASIMTSFLAVELEVEWHHLELVAAIQNWKVCTCFPSLSPPSNVLLRIPTRFARFFFAVLISTCPKTRGPL
ncbi:hypothetical protein BS47DRAFT_1337346 [Hydnum rufescens UP504]|uniref:Uncharacterized protein n=1 Tax=Hydnum rufescens UP504 TaxID=1448309 RepID=A0A9P6B7U7_9AGAM|nr:hypothetical protein BS47DRAFT_1337346 [Hydnum rufescens UP504]